MADVDRRAAALGRVVDEVGGDLVELLAARLPGADLRTLMLEVARRRAAAVAPPALVRRRDDDRLTRTTGVDARRLHALGARMLQGLPLDVEVLELSPVAPLGAHSAVATVSQDKVVSTVRAVEVAADPTNALAIEAALRRRGVDRKGAAPLRLAALQRVLRAQPFDDPSSSQHFTLLGVVTAVRGRVETRRAVARLVRDLVGAVRVGGGTDVTVLVTDLGDGAVAWPSIVAGALGGLDDTTVRDHPQRRAGRGYYREVAFTILTTIDGRTVDVGDGGVVDWTGQMLADRHELLVIGGIGLDRLVTGTS